MQLPPTILSVNKHEKKANNLKPSTSKLSTKSPKTKEPVKEPEVEAAVEEESEGSTREGSEDDTDADGINEPAPKPVSPPIKPRAQKKKEKVRSLRPPRTLETTLFDRLEKMYGPDIKRMLNVQYR